MSDTVTRLHYASENFTVANDDDAPDADELAAMIGTVVQDGGGFVTIPTVRGEARILFTPGIPVWITVNKREAEGRVGRIR